MAASTIETLLKEDNIILHRFKEDEKEWVDAGRGGFRIYKSLDTNKVWLGLIQPGGRNVLSSPNEVIISEDVQLWAHNTTLRINYKNRAGEMRKIAFHPLRSSIDLEEPEEEGAFQDFVEDNAAALAAAEPEKPATPAESQPETAPANEDKEKKEDNSKSVEAKDSTPKTEKVENDEKADAQPSPQKEVKPEPAPLSVDLLAGKQKPSFPVQVASILKEHTSVQAKIW